MVGLRRTNLFLAAVTESDNNNWNTQLIATKIKSASENKLPGLANCRGIIFHHDIARLHINMIISAQLEECGWEKIV